MMKIMIKLFACILYFWIVYAADNNILQFNEQGTFKIVQFTDLHYGNSQYDNDRTEVVQDVILEKEKPDLVIITGDLVSGYEWDKREKDWFKKRWEQLISPMVKHNIRWAIALGNHDVEGDLTGEEIVKLDITQELSLTQLGPSDIGGATNYYLPIYNYNSTDEIGQILWIFDSGHDDCLGVSGWGCVRYDQVAWYRNASHAHATTHERTSPIPALAFFHIPLYEHLDLWNVRGVKGDLGETEGVCCSSVNTGLYAAMREMGDVKGVYCGHDHSNDYIGDYHGISLGFGRKTGYGCYGPPFGWQRGARVLEISQNQFGANSWLRLEDGSIEIQQQNTVSSRKFLGCCSMEGHGRVAMKWPSLLIAAAIDIAAIIGLIAMVRIGIRKYKERKVKWGGGVVVVNGSGNGSNNGNGNNSGNGNGVSEKGYFSLPGRARAVKRRFQEEKPTEGFVRVVVGE